VPDLWTGGAFGLALDGNFPAPGLAGSLAPAGAPAVTIDGARAEVDTAWDAENAERVLNWSVEDGSDYVRIYSHPEHGYRFSTADRGEYIVAHDGRSIVLAPPPGQEPWWWQRYLIGQVLPLAAILNGFETFHASAVAHNGRVIAFLAASGVGKSSLAIAMMLRGARFVTDDVAPLSLVDGVPVVHPGPPLTSIREAEYQRLQSEGVEVGTPIGRDDSGVRAAIEREEQPLPLGSIYLLERTDAGAEPVFTHVDPDMRTLAAQSYDFIVRTPARIVRQLDVYSAVAAHVRVTRVEIPPSVDAGALAARLEQYEADAAV
jgi:hypothetical protein